MKINLPVTLGVLTCLLLLGPCQSAAQRYVCNNAEAACVRDKDAGAVIVFVHGISGDETTWQATGSPSWPSMLRQPGQDVSRANIYLHQFESDWIGPTSSIRELARRTRTSLENREVFDHRIIVFVAHSLGGLVVNEMLRDMPIDHSQQRVHVFALGTPWLGGDFKQLESAIGSIATTTLRKHLSKLALEASDFKSEPVAGVGYTCLYERETFALGQRVVRPDSATGICDDKNRAEIPGDHRQIVKPKSVADPQYEYLVSEFRRFAIPRSEPVTSGAYFVRWPPQQRWDASDKQWKNESGGQWIMCGLVQTFKAKESGRLTSLNFPMFSNEGGGRVFVKVYRLDGNEWSEQRKELWSIKTPIGNSKATELPLPIETKVEIVKDSWYAIELYEEGGSQQGNANLYRETWGDAFPGRLYSKTNRDGTCGTWFEIPSVDVGFAMWVTR